MTVSPHNAAIFPGIVDNIKDFYKYDPVDSYSLIGVLFKSFDDDGDTDVAYAALKEEAVWKGCRNS